jgi:hypothetical protein
MRLVHLTGPQSRRSVADTAMHERTLFDVNFFSRLEGNLRVNVRGLGRGLGP